MLGRFRTLSREDGNVKNFDQILEQGVSQGAVPGVSATVVTIVPMTKIH